MHRKYQNQQAFRGFHDAGHIASSIKLLYACSVSRLAAVYICVWENKQWFVYRSLVLFYTCLIIHFLMAPRKTEESPEKCVELHNSSLWVGWPRGHAVRFTTWGRSIGTFHTVSHPQCQAPTVSHRQWHLQYLQCHAPTCTIMYSEQGIQGTTAYRHNMFIVNFMANPLIYRGHYKFRIVLVPTPTSPQPASPPPPPRGWEWDQDI